jgi:ABC-type transporter MlaC component
MTGCGSRAARLCIGVRGALVASAVVLFGMLLPAGWASTPSAADFIKRLLEHSADLGGSADAGRPDAAARLAARLPDFVDVDEMARRALGDSYAVLEDGLRAQYLAAYRGLLSRAIQRRLAAARSDDIVVLGVRHPEKDLDVVATRIVLPGRAPHDLYWFVRTRPSLRIVDLVVDGALVTEMQRREFAAILHSSSDDLSVLPRAIDRLRP